MMRTDRGARDAAAPDAGGRRRHRTRTRTRTMHTGAWCASAESARSSRTVDLRGGHCSRPPPSVLPAPPHGDRTRSPARRLPRRPLAVAKKKRSARPASGGRTTRGAGERRRAGGRPSVPPARCPGLLVGRSLFAGPGPASRSQGTTSASHRSRPGQEIDPRRARARLGACPPVAVAPPPFGADSVIVFRARAAFSRLRGLIFSCHRLRHPPRLPHGRVWTSESLSLHALLLSASKSKPPPAPSDVKEKKNPPPPPPPPIPPETVAPPASRGRILFVWPAQGVSKAAPQSNTEQRWNNCVPVSLSISPPPPHHHPSPKTGKHS